VLTLQGAPVFYDNWVARDINGTALENAPFEQVFHHTESNHRFQQHLPVQGMSFPLHPLLEVFSPGSVADSSVQSCWNGIAVLDPAPFYAPKPVKFRMARLPDGECSASECSLICSTSSSRLAFAISRAIAD
jgi:alpha-1,3-mannosyltransferase